MSLFLQEHGDAERAALVQKLISLYRSKSFTADEIHYILDVLLLSSICKDGTVSRRFKDIASEFANMKLSFYSGEDSIEDSSSGLYGVA